RRAVNAKSYSPNHLPSVQATKPACRSCRSREVQRKLVSRLLPSMHAGEGGGLTPSVVATPQAVSCPLDRFRLGYHCDSTSRANPFRLLSDVAAADLPAIVTIHFT